MNIVPTIGRKMWYHNVDGDCMTVHSDQPCDATVVHVNADGTVNLSIKDHVGNMTERLNVPIETDTILEAPKAVWMPFQRQAAGMADAVAPTPAPTPVPTPPPADPAVSIYPDPPTATVAPVVVEIPVATNTPAPTAAPVADPAVGM